MTKGDLDGVTVWGRPIKPVAMGFSGLMLTLTIINIANTGDLRNLWVGDLVAVITALSFTMLMAGWFGKVQVMAEIGLLTGSMAFVLRSTVIGLYVGPFDPDVWLGLSAAVIAGGAYLLEKWDINNLHKRGD